MLASTAPAAAFLPAAAEGQVPAGSGASPAVDVAAVQRALDKAAVDRGFVAVGAMLTPTAPLTVPPHTGLGRGALDITNTTRTGLLLQGDGSSLEDLSIVSAGPLHEAIGSFGKDGGASHVRLSGVRIDVRDTLGSANGLNLEQGGMSFWSMRDLDIDAKGYGLLTSVPTGAAGIENMLSLIHI